MNKTNYFVVRMGHGGKYVVNAKNENFVAIGWNELEDLSWILKEENEENNRNKLKELYNKAYVDEKESLSVVGVSCGQIMKFIKEIKIGDVVLTPDPINRIVLIGKVVGNYQYKKDWNDDCKYQHRKEVKWIKEIKRDDFSQKAKNTLGSLLTVFSLKSHENEIRNIIEPFSGKEKKEKLEQVIISGQELKKTILDRLHNLSGKEFEYFITHLLNLMGFEAATTQLVGDGGVDVIGTISAVGLAQVTLKVQAKRVSGSIGNKEILQLRGTLGVDEHGTLITTSFFTKPAREEAEAEGKKPIQLVEGEELVEMILNYYGELDQKYKDLLMLKEKETSITEKFITIIEK